MTIVAPLTNQSGAGTRISSAPTIGVRHPRAKVWAVDGSPADAVNFGLSAVFDRHAPDLVLSGTNFGPNLAALATHSGTVGAAMTALEDGVPSIAVSTGGLEAPVPDRILNAMRTARAPPAVRTSPHRIRTPCSSPPTPTTATAPGR
ncbi:5'/3'-nucleotidase SurE [Streptomyces sp. NPDC001153]